MTGRSLSAEERVHARRALLFLAERSAPARLAEALGLTVVALQKARAPSHVVGRRLAARVASVAGSTSRTFSRARGREIFARGAADGAARAPSRRRAHR